MDDSRPPRQEPAPPPGLPSSVELSELIAAAEQRLLGGPRTLTRAEVAERAGVAQERLQQLWRALGFASVPDGSALFTEADLQALENVRGLQRIGGIDDELMVAMVRIIGQSFARLASWQSQLMVEMLQRRPELIAHGAEDVGPLMDLLLPTVERIQDYVWRRQLAAVFERMAANAGSGPADLRPVAVGFVDMAGFTSFTRSATEAQLRDVLTAFESAATESVAGHGGQIVKTIGDEILFVCDDPVQAAEIALGLLEAAAADEVLPRLRAGLAYGPVVSRLGDVFGSTVNIASRLTGLARTDAVLIDDGLAEALRDEPAFTLRPMRATSVRGFHHLHPWRMRRADG